MDERENGLGYLKVLISMYIDNGDERMEAFLVSVLQGMERMKVCV